MGRFLHWDDALNQTFKGIPARYPREFGGNFEMDDLAASEEEGFTAILQALANPAARHFVELLALAPRTHAELSQHFDLLPPQIIAMQRTLEKLGIAKTEYKRLYLDRAGLDRVQRWLDRIAEIASHSSRPRGAD